MAKQPKQYYWLKLKEDFFEDDTIKFLREQTNGSEYCIFYLILCCKALKTEGRLVRVVGNTIIPYDTKALAKLTDCSEDTVRVALGLLKQFGVIEINESGEIFIQQLNEMVGSETEWARIKRKRKSLQNAVEANIKKDIESLEKTPNVVKNTITSEKITGEKLENWKISNKSPVYIRDKRLEIRDKKIKVSKKESFDDILNEKVQDEELRNLFLEFIKMRKMIKAPLTNYALKLGINKVEKLSKGNTEKAKRIVEQSIERSWKGFWDVKDDDEIREKPKGMLDLS